MPVADRSLLTRPMKIIIALVSLIAGIASLYVFQFALAFTESLVLSRTVVFATLSTISLLIVFSVRSLTTPVWKTAIWSNPWLIGSVGIGWILQLLPIYAPGLEDIFRTTMLSTHHWIVIIGTGLVTVMLIEFAKWRLRLNHHNTSS